MYGGAILIGFGWSLADAPLGLIPTALLVLLFDLKARREEAWLIERFPAYATYRAGTPRRFVPWLY
jgi:protein-S-isoprenylcysteine O-methyltransferase Ste14